MSAAAQDLRQYDEGQESSAPALLRQQVADKLAAHRSRRLAMDRRANPEALSGSAEVGASGRAKRIASMVAERYAQSPSYRAFLAAEAEEATRKAHAAAEVAVRTAHAIEAAQRTLLEEWKQEEQSLVETSLCREDVTIEETVCSPTIAQHYRSGLSVKLFENAGERSKEAVPDVPQAVRFSGGSLEETEETRALDEEISFRGAPTFEIERPTVGIPGNLLEFPRQLVAARKARPRYAEGPLTAEGGSDGAQLRIFEVEAEQMTSAPPVETLTPEWSSIWLDALAESAVQPEVEQVEAMETVTLHVAAVERRVMAAAVDVCVVLFGFVAFATLFAYRTSVLPSFGVAAAWSMGCVAGLFLLYQMLFYTFSDATPGMRYARIGLCTFADENPSRSAMRKRTVALALAGLPLGLGFLWAYLDDDRLGWHDRMSRMYQRSY